MRMWHASSLWSLSLFLFFCSDLPVIRYAISYAKRFFILAKNPKIIKKEKKKTQRNLSMKWREGISTDGCTLYLLSIIQTTDPCANCTTHVRAITLFWHWDAVALTWILGTINGGDSVVAWVSFLHFAAESGTFRKSRNNELEGRKLGSGSCGARLERNSAIEKWNEWKRIYLHNFSRSLQIKII